MTTKDRIKQELLKLLEKYSADDLTLKLFCAESGLSKQTLYNHYYCLMDALEDAYRSEFTERLRDCGHYLNWVEGFRTLLVILLDRRQVCLHLYRSSRGEDFMEIIRKYGVALLEKGIDDCARDRGFTVSDKDRTFMLRFYMYVFMGIIRDFIEGKLQEDPDYIAGRCDVMMRHHIRHSLQNLKDLEEGRF